MMTMDAEEAREARLDEIHMAVAALARRERKPEAAATLIEVGDRALELLATAAAGDLEDAGGFDGERAFLALGYAAGLALTLRQALRHLAGVLGVEAAEYTAPKPSLTVIEGSARRLADRSRARRRPTTTPRGSRHEQDRRSRSR